MGLTCANGHMFVGAGVDAQVAFANACGAIGYEPISTNQVTSAELVAISSEQWVSFLSLKNPEVVTRELTGLAKEMSAQAKCPVVVTSVYDSDEFAYVIFNQGRQSDAFTTNDQMLPIPSRNSYPKKRAERWSKLFGTAIHSDDVRLVTRTPEMFADVQLIEMSRLIGLPAKQALLKPNDLADIDVQVTGYRKVVDGSQVIQPLRDLPEVKLLDTLVGQSESIGFEIEVPRAALSNPVLEVSGSAIERDLVNVSNGGGLWHCGLAHVTSGAAQNFVATVEMAARGSVLVSSDALTPDAFRQAPAERVTLYFWAGLQATAEGAGCIRCRFRPAQQSSDSIVLRPAFNVTVGPAASWIPMRCVDEGVTEQLAVKMLNQPKILSAVSILADQSESFGSLRGQIERWLTSRNWNDSHEVVASYEGQLHPTTLNLPKRKAAFTLDEIGTTRKWQRLFAQPEKTQCLLLQVRNLDGVALGGATLQRACEDDATTHAGTIHLGLWISTDANELDLGAVARERQQLVEIIDDHFELLAGIQGWLGHWNWIPIFERAEQRDYTPYEDASAFDRSNTSSDFMSADWCTRYLRAVSECMWLGGSLLSYVDPDALERVAHVSPVGLTSRRFRLQHDLQLNQMEEVLSPILPS